MATPILATKLFIPPPRSRLVTRPRLLERLNAGLAASRAPGVTLVCAPAGFGKTTLVSEWLTGSVRREPAVPVAWLSLDQGDNDPGSFLAYLIAALQTIAPELGTGAAAALHSPQPPAADAILTTLLNDIARQPEHFVLVLDDYHVIEAAAVNRALAFLLEHLPPQMHLVLTSREDPDLPLARLRAGGQLTELRAADLRFSEAEAAEFLNPVMALNLSAEQVAALENRTEGWIAGLQLAALSLRTQADATGFIRSFSGSHHFVLDYLVEEVLQQQPEHVQRFLLRTSILDRMCGGLCEAVLRDASGSGQATLEYMERANLFIVPLDNERRWYRYHHLFAELLRQRLGQASAGTEQVAELHTRASQWYEDHGLDLEAFRHAAAANDIARAERLIEGRGIPLHLRGAVTMILDWFGTLPASVLDARPALLWRYASLLLVGGQTTGVAEKLNAAEAALPADPSDAQTRNLLGHIAGARAVLALTHYAPEVMLAQSRRALEYLAPDNPSARANASWTMGYAYMFQGRRAEARQALGEAITLSQAAGDTFTNILACIGLGAVQESDNELHAAAETYRRVLAIAGDQPLQIVNEAHQGLGRLQYEWNDLDGAEQHAQQGLQLARQYDRVIDRFLIAEVFLARLKLARGDAAGAAAMLAKTYQSASQPHFQHRLPEVAAAQVLVLLRQGNLAAAAELARRYPQPLSQARLHLAQGEPEAALAVLETWRRQVEAKGWADERLKALVLEALAHQAREAPALALERLDEALALAAPSGFIRTFVDEGPPMARLVALAAAQGKRPDEAQRLLAAFGAAAAGWPAAPQPLVEALSPRELEVLQLIAQGLSNSEIGERLFLALDTVKGYNSRIYGKLAVQRRTEAVARARELGLL